MLSLSLTAQYNLWYVFQKWDLGYTIQREQGMMLQALECGSRDWTKHDLMAKGVWGESDDGGCIPTGILVQKNPTGFLESSSGILVSTVENTSRRS